VTGDQAIAQGAFYGCENITNIVLSEYITGIRDYAFYKCTGLTEIVIPSTVTLIGRSAFAYSGIHSISIPESVSTISTHAFNYCKNLQSVVLSECVVTINSYAFQGCNALTDIYIPSSVTTIGEYVFEKCTMLTEINIPASITSVGQSAFSGCTALQTVYIDDLDKWIRIQFASETSNPMYYASQLLLNNQPITGDIVIPDDITKLYDRVFKGTDITSIVIPNTVTLIGKSIFEGCENITTLTVPFIGYSAMSNTESSYASSSGYSRFIGYWFGAPTNMSYPYTNNNQYVPQSLTTVIVTGDQAIAQGAFYGCENITSIILNEDITGIRTYAFYECTGLTEIIIPSTVTLIESSVFAYSRIESITFNGTIEQWNSISKQTNWNNNSSITQIICTDGIITLN
jgi:hypothetical protein